jgi:3',5'-cyclic AMP phosphodiesterase CpdA
MRFAVAGDVGTGGVEEVATAAAMAELEGVVEYTALLLLGDNVYEDGDPGEIQSSLFAPFADVLDNGTELLPVLGNHDVDSGFGDAQVAALGMSGPWYSVAFGDVRIVALDSNRPDDADQLEWLAQTLAASEERWKIVLLHHPPYSGGWHGSDLRVRSAFGSLFEEYGVQLVLAGHDHDYQRSEPINGVTYVVSGGAAQLRPAHLADFSVVAWSAHHFLDIAVWDDHLDLRAIDQELGVIDEVVIRS